MRARLALLLAAACLLPAVSSPAAAQEEAPQTGVPLWFHVGAGNAMWINDLKDDPDQTATERYRNFLTWGNAGRTVTDTITSTWVPEADTPFLPGENVVISLTVGTNVGWSATWGSFSVTTRLLAGDIQVIQGGAQTVEFPPGTSDYFETLVWELPPEIQVLPAGVPLQWIITATGTSSDYVLSASDTYGGHSHVVLPIEGPSMDAGPAVINTTLPDVPVAWNTTHRDAYDAVEHYTWNSSLESALLTFAGNATAGNASARVVDPLGAVQLETDILANVTTARVEVPLASASAGNWTLTITYTGFVGSLSFSMDPLAFPTPDVGTHADTDSSNRTADADGKGSPGLGPAMVVGALLALAVVVRRREA